MPPPPGAAYRVLVKAGMRPRQERVLLLTAMATHVVFTSALLAPSALWRPRVAAGTAALVFGALLPLLLVRRTRLLAAAPEPASRCVSRGAYVAALARSAAAWQDIGLHALLGGVLALVYSLTATYAFGWSAATAPARFVPAHGVYYVNEAWLVLLALSTALGAVYAAAVLVLLPGARSGVPPFDAGALGVSLRVRCVRTVARQAPRALVLLPVAAALFFAYVCVRASLWAAVLRVTGVETLVRRYIVPSFRLPFAPLALGASLAPPLAMVLVLFEVTHTLFDVYWTHPLPPLTARDKDPNTVLLAGLGEPHEFFCSQAFAELAHMAMHDAARRRAIFDDVQRQHGRPVAWSGVCDAALRVLGGVAVSAPAPAPTPAPAPPAAPAPRSSIWHILARAPPAAGARPSGTAAPAPTGVPVPFLRIVSWALSALGRTVWTLVPGDAKHALLPQTVHTFVFAPAPALLLDAELRPHCAAAAWAARALQHLVLASLAEDKYGSVQKDVPRVLDALVRAHSRLSAARERVEGIAAEADGQLVREVRMLRGMLVADAGADASFSTAYAPFYNEMQAAWQAYAAEDAALCSAVRTISEAFARWRVPRPSHMEARMPPSA